MWGHNTQIYFWNSNLTYTFIISIPVTCVSVPDVFQCGCWCSLPWTAIWYGVCRDVAGWRLWPHKAAAHWSHRSWAAGPEEEEKESRSWFCRLRTGHCQVWCCGISSCSLCLLTHSMVQSPSWEANWFAASQEIPCIFMEPEGSLPHSQASTTCPVPSATLSNFSSWCDVVVTERRDAYLLEAHRYWGSLLAFSTQVRGFKHGQSRQIF